MSRQAGSAISRRRFLRSVSHGSLGLLAGLEGATKSSAAPATSLTEAERIARIRGLLIGGLLGDALGGPVEFQSPEAVGGLPDAPHRWTPGELLDARALAATASRLRLRGYAPLRPTPEPYAHWSHNAPAGTVTDDSRHKFLLLHALRDAGQRDAWPLTERSLAQAFIDWPQSPAVRSRPQYRQLSADWLEEFLKGARWLQGERDPGRALPPERMWTGLPTCSGQMVLPPLAAVFPGRPEAAYRAAYALGFFDNGFGKDLNAALVAALAAALDAPAPEGKGDDWQPVIAAMRATDPFAYAKVPWTTRPVEKWLDRAHGAAQRAGGAPAALFSELDALFADTIKWQAEVPFTVVFALLALCPDDPLAALQLTIEWGHDTDSYAALAGALIGARHGDQVFPREMREAVEQRLHADYGEDLDEWLGVLARAARQPRAVE